MAGLLDKTLHRLPPTRTYATREVEFVPVNDDEFILILTRSVREFRGRAKLMRDCYHGQREDAVGVMGRAFLLLKTTDVEVSEPYRVTLGPGLPTCTCTAANCRVPGDEHTDGCIHRDSLALLVAEGEL